tara:strand:- start:25934 stop:26692 length:759 start_codon:yes stop_codon:yes gene_type:complete
MADELIPHNFPPPSPVDFAKIPKERLEAMYEAALEVVECHRVLAKTEDNIVGELIRGHEQFYEWDHYPTGDVFDQETHSQFYYHAHPQELRGGEHGHFHTFLRPKGMPRGVQPALVADLKTPEEDDEALSHLIAISMDNLGFPIRMFTTNRWVTGEYWYSAEDVRKMIDHFMIDLAQPSWPVNRWVSAMVRLFRPQIAALIDARDVAIAQWERDHPDVNVFEDEDLEVTSVLEINIDEQIGAVTTALENNPG